MGRGSKPTKGKAKPAVPRRSRTSEGAGVRDLETRLAEALQREAEALKREAEASKREAEAQEQQTATAEILRVISGSPADVQPVFESIAESSLRLCGALFSSVYRFDGEFIHMVAHQNYPPVALERSRQLFPVRPSRQLFTARAILERAVVHVPDVLQDPEHAGHDLMHAAGFRSVLAIPMIHRGNPVGAITVWHAAVAPFSQKHIALLQTFADQAVIAIENVRLFTELQEKNRALTKAHAQVSESLEQQTATSEILGVISRSQTDVQPVFDAIVTSAVRLCDGLFGTLWRFDGELIHQVAQHNYTAEALEEMRRVYPCRPSRAHGSARAILERAVVHIPDNELDPEFRVQALSRAVGWRSGVFVPMLREGAPIGVIAVSRREVQPFSDAEIQLLKTFADQAVIAIENVRLFTELQTSNRELTTALDTQTATSEILRAISQTQIDVQPVFEVIADSAMRLLGAWSASVWRYENDLIRLSAVRGGLPGSGEAFLEQRQVARHPADDSPASQTVLTRAVFHSVDVETDRAWSPQFRAEARMRGFRSIVAVPMLRGDNALGVIAITRTEVGGFSPAEIALLQTFADQAVIAIENVRLFSELKEKNQALTQAHAHVTEALEQQTATAEILRVISESQTDLQPVFEAIVRSAAQLCEATFAVLHRVDRQLITFVAHHGMTEREAEGSRQRFPLPIDRETAVGRAILDRQITHIQDIRHDSEYRASAWQMSFRTVLAVPLLREGVPVGAIGLWRREVQPFSQKQIELVETFADQAVIAIENVRLFTELQEKNQALTTAHAQMSESLEQQTATSEVLRVISNSPTDVQPVFTAVATSAARLCEAFDAAIHLVDGAVLRLVAHQGPIPPDVVVPLAPGTLAGRVIRERRAKQVADMPAETDEYPVSSAFARQRGFRTILGVPLLCGGEAIGLITIRRSEVRPFTERQAELLKTFADQAVIAIENVRLFNETKEALERQTATSEILRVISSSPTDVQPVFDVIAANARRLCRASFGGVARYDGELAHLVALDNVNPDGADAIRNAFPRPVDEQSVVGRAIRARAIVQISDVSLDRAYGLQSAVNAAGFRSFLGAPMLLADQAIGLIVVGRPEVGSFSDNQRELLRTFADQAVIAIENARLFKELEARNRDLTTALDRQMATSEILRVISSSPTDIQPVFDAIVRSAVRLCDGLHGALDRFDGELLHFAAQYNYTPEALQMTQRMYPRQPDRKQAAGRAILTGNVVNIADVQADPEYATDLAVAGGWRSVLNVPMLREGKPIGTIGVIRGQAGRFSDAQVELLRTFADQAVIAIENVRLFTELQEKNKALTTAHAQVSEALDQQTATSEILRVISSSPTDTQPVFDEIVTSAAHLCSAMVAVVCRLIGDQLHLAAHWNTNPEWIDVARREYPTSADEGIAGLALRERRVVHVPDIEADDRFPFARRLARTMGYRSIIFVPMLHEGVAVGTLGVGAPSPFSGRQIETLKTFADQAVIAIENVRLFKELEARTQDLTRSVGELRALGEVGQAISSTLNLQTVLSTIVARATQLSGTDAGVIYEYDERRELFEPRATERLEEDIVRALVATPIRKGEGATGQLAEVREPIQVADVRDRAQAFQAREVLIRAGYRAALAVPLVREDRLLGGLTVFRKTPGEFAPEVVDLLGTFATQSALAIQNARLFREIEDKSRLLEVASQHKSEFLANMSHELRTPLNAIIGFSEVLTDRMFGELNEKQEEYLKDIYASGTHLLSLINDILDLSKIEAGRMELELTDFDLPTAIDNALMLIRERAGRRSIALHSNVDKQQGQIQGDERKIRQVVLNLLSNAIKFTPEGGRIEVGAVPKDGFVEVSVSDTGIGIAPEDQEKVFEEFRQVGTAAKKIEGTGLGLTLCRKFVELHGGKIWVKSQLGQGSIFTFTIPVRRGE